MIMRDLRAAGAKAPPTESKTVRLGVIDYLNVAPVYAQILDDIASGRAAPAIEAVAGFPAEMNAALAASDVDISNVSSFAFGTHVRDWLLIPRLSVAAHGRVDSVLLFSWQANWRGLDGRSIALTDQSATSIELVKALCAQRHHIAPTYVVAPGDLDAMLAQHEAALLIGDRALVERHAHREVAGRGVPHVFDLAAEWHAWTGLPFVFALWAARADSADAVRRSGVIERLRASKVWGLAHLDQIAGPYADRLGLPLSVCADYLRLLDYELAPQDLLGLRTFLEITVPGFTWGAVRLFPD